MRTASIFLTLIGKRFFRSPSFGKDITIQVILGVIAFAVVVYFLVLGFLLEKVIVDALKQDNAVGFLNRLLIYYFFGEFITRYFIQSLPTLDIQPLLHLPIKRNRIVNFFLGISFIQVTNIFVLLLFTHFAFSAVARGYGITQAWLWLLSLWIISLVLHYIVVLLKLSSNKIGWTILFIIAFCALVAGADYFAWIELSLVSEKLFNSILQGYTAAGLLLATLIILHVVTGRAIIRRFYRQEPKTKGTQFYYATDFSFLQNFGQAGTWLKIELKMILRNKRTREVFFMSTMFLVQELFLCLTMTETDYGVFLFMGIVCTGLFVANYGQYTFSWQGDHFDFTLAQPTSLRSYVEAKCWLLAFMTVLWFIFSVPLAYFGWEILLINLASMLYNIGVNMFVIMNMAMLYTTKMSLKKGGAFNYEGAGASQWLMGIPFLFGPIVIYASFNAMGYKELGIAAVGVVGVIGMLLYKKLVDLTYKRFLHRRYTIADSFRKE